MLQRNITMMQRSRGVLLLGSLPPPSGGIATHLADLARLLRNRGVPARLAGVPQGLSRSAGPLASLLSALGGAALRGDVVHLHTNGHNAGSWRLAALVAAASTPGRAVLTVHSGLAPSWIARHPRRCRAVAGRFARVLCVSEAVAAALSGAGVEAGRLLVGPAFLSTALPLPLPPAGLAALRRRTAGPLLAASLALGEEYGAATLLDGLAVLQCSTSDARLILFGPAGRHRSLDEAVRARDLGAAVARFGDLPRAEALAVIAASDLFVRPTLADGDSVSVREARALGVRTLASDAAARPAGVACFRAGDPRALAEAARALLGAPPPPPLLDDGLAVLEEAWGAAGLVLPAPRGTVAFAPRVILGDAIAAAPPAASAPPSTATAPAPPPEPAVPPEVAAVQEAL